MRKIFKNLLAILLIIGLHSQFLVGFSYVNAAENYTTYRSID